MSIPIVAIRKYDLFYRKDAIFILKQPLMFIWLISIYSDTHNMIINTIEWGIQFNQNSTWQKPWVPESQTKKTLGDKDAYSSQSIGLTPGCVMFWCWMSPFIHWFTTITSNFRVCNGVYIWFFNYVIPFATGPSFRILDWISFHWPPLRQMYIHNSEIHICPVGFANDYSWGAGETRIRLKHTLARWVNTRSQTAWATEKLRNLNSIAHTYDEQTFSPLDTTVIIISPLSLAMFIFVVQFYRALAEGSDFESKWDKLSSSGETRFRNRASRAPICLQTECPLMNWPLMTKQKL